MFIMTGNVIGLAGLVAILEGLDMFNWYSPLTRHQALLVLDQHTCLPDGHHMCSPCVWALTTIYFFKTGFQR